MVWSLPSDVIPCVNKRLHNTRVSKNEPYPGSRWHFFKNEGDLKVTDVLQTAVHTQVKNELSDNSRSDKVIHIRMTVL